MAELSPYEKSTLICAECRESDRLYKDSHGIFCHRCGPSVPVTTRDIGERRALIVPQEAVKPNTSKGTDE